MSDEHSLMNTQIITPYGSNTLPIKKLSLYGPLLLQTQTAWSTTTLSSIQSMVNSLQNGRSSFILVHTINATIPTKKQFLYFSQFLHPYSTLTFSQNHPYNPLANTPCLYISAIFHLPIFVYNHPNNLHQKYFPYLNHFANSGCVKGPGSQGFL